MTISQLTKLKIETIKKEFHILFFRNLNEKNEKQYVGVKFFLFKFKINENCNANPCFQFSFLRKNEWPFRYTDSTEIPFKNKTTEFTGTHAIIFFQVHRAFKLY